MNESIDIRIVIAIAAVMVIASLLLTVLAGVRNHARRDAVAFLWLGGTNLSFLMGATGLMTGQVLPFWASASMVVLGMLWGLISGFVALNIGIGDNPAPLPYAALGAGAALLQLGLVVVLNDAGALVVSSSVVNGALGVVFAQRLWGRALVHGRQLAMLAAAPFAAIGVAYLARLGVVGLDLGGHALAVATLVITFLMAFSALQWGFALIAFRAARLNGHLQIARDKAEQASALKSRFLANMSHELRTPLNGILGMAQGLENVLLEPQQAQMLTAIRDSGDRLLMRMNDILDLSELQAGELELVPVIFDLPAEIAQTAVQFADVAAGKGVAFDIMLDPAMARLRRGDGPRMRRMLGNVLSNAVNFTQTGRISLAVQGSAANVRIVISDTGAGMTTDQLARVFDPFMQADSSVTRRVDGAGLGMPVVRGLAQAMGGTVTVASRVGQGTCVTLDLPLAAIADSPETPVAQHSTRPPDRGAGIARATAQVVLVAEDNKVNQRVLKAFLQDPKLDLVMVENGAAALEMARHNSFDLFLFDVMMPEMDGVTALRQIRAEYGACAKPVPPAIVVTANVASAQVAQYHDAGFSDVIAKPVRKAQLLACLAAHGVGSAPVAEAP
ncbi:ATP-binding protein [Roseinatronobacter sp. NSM]|uniref:ATP-binding protein n=1 Tax=Roseinatronobacter sp. NSM TaxID=3457785 RepID=UPI0040371E8B